MGIRFLCNCGNRGRSLRKAIAFVSGVEPEVAKLADMKKSITEL